MEQLQKRGGICEYCLRALACIVFALTVLYIFTIWNLTFHSDSAASNMLAREQMLTGQWFPETWNYSTGISIFFFNAPTIVLSIFTGNQILLRNLSVLLFLIVFVLTFRYFSRRILCSGFYLVVLCFLCSNTSATVTEISFAQAAYLPDLLYSIVLLVLTMRAFDEQFRVKSKRWLIGLLVFVLFLSLYGVLSLAYQLLPLLAAVVLCLAIEHWNMPLIQVKKQLFGGAKALLMITASAIVGLFLYKALEAYTGFVSGTNVTYLGTGETANRFLAFFLSAIGYRTNVQLFSVSGIMNAVVLLGFGAVLVCCILLFTKYAEQPFAVKVFMNFSLIVIAIHIYFVFTIYCQENGTERYLFRPIVFMWMLASYYIYTYILPKGFMPKLLVIAALAVFSLPNMLSTLPQVKNYPEAREAQLGLVQFLEEHEQTHGYATFWNAGNNMVLSDFEVEIGGVLLNQTIEPHYWLSSDNSYDPDLYEGESFLLLTESENAQYANSHGMNVLGKPKEVLSYSGYVIYVYPYNIAKNSFSGNGFDKTEMMEAMVVSDEAMRQADGTLSLTAGQIIYGPYIQLPDGNYEIELEFSELQGDVYLRLTGDSGGTLLREEVITETRETITYTAQEDINNFEIVLMTEGLAKLKSVKITRNY